MEEASLERSWILLSEEGDEINRRFVRVYQSLFSFIFQVYALVRISSGESGLEEQNDPL